MKNSDWPSFHERAEDMFGNAKGKSPEQIILDDREERL